MSPRAVTVDEEEEEGKSVQRVKWHDGATQTRNGNRKLKNKESRCEQGEPICCTAEQTTVGLSTRQAADDDADNVCVCVCVCVCRREGGNYV